jgi:P27 family predicted phage terminase small subunit
MNEPKIPSDICSEAKSRMKDIVKVLTDNNMITPVDFPALEMLAFAYDSFFENEKILKAEGEVMLIGNGTKKSHPSVKNRLDAMIQITKLMEGLGMTPKARKEIQKSKDKLSKLTPVDNFFNSVVEKRGGVKAVHSSS